MANNQAEREKFIRALTEMQKICKEVNDDARKCEPQNQIIYEVMQLSELTKMPSEMPAEKQTRPTSDNYLNQIADFYNNNWLGNQDFMHIPNFSQVMENYMKYPVIIAREKGKNEILAISTIKHDENNPEQIDPYFPEPEAKYFSVTGILVKRGTPHKGMGKKIYEIAIRGAHEYNKYYPGTRIMCVIDCRNWPSLRALSGAVETINENELVGEGQELPANIAGFYTLSDEAGELIEAPTLVLEVGLESQNKGIANLEDKTLEYSKTETGTLFGTLLQELKDKLEKYKIQQPIKNEDVGTGTVHYYTFDADCSLEGTKIVSNGTEEGNDRCPIDDQTKRMQGPVIMHWGDENLGDDTSER